MFEFLACTYPFEVLVCFKLIKYTFTFKTNHVTFYDVNQTSRHEFSAVNIQMCWVKVLNSNHLILWVCVPFWLFSEQPERHTGRSHCKMPRARYRMETQSVLQCLWLCGVVVMALAYCFNFQKQKPFFMSWTQRYKTFSIYTKDPFLSNIVHTSVQICVSEHFSFAKINHPTLQMWHIKMLIGQHDYCTGVP